MWGERYAFRCLINKYQKKYPHFKKSEDHGSFRILSSEGSILVEIHWLNHNKEAQHPYDIRVLNDGLEEFIEVKTTSDDQNKWMIVSQNEWDCAETKGEKYSIFRVFNAGSPNAYFELIQNPVKLWKEEKLEVWPFNLRIKI